MSAQGNDTNYGTQLALGMTTTAAYYRVYNNQTWSDWKSLINTDTTYSANNGVGLSGTTFYNSGVRAVSTGSANGTISVNTNGSSADVAVKGLGSAAYTESSAYATSSHTHGLSHSNLNQTASDATTNAWATVGIDPTVNGYVLKSIRYMTNVPPWGPPSYGAGIAFGGKDTKALINIGYASPNITFVGGNHNSSKTAPTWYIKLTGTTTTTYNLDNFYVTTTSRTANTVLAAPNGSNGAATFRSLVAADIPDLSSTYLKLSGGTMTGDITFTGAGTSSYPSKSKGIYWNGGTDAIDMYYNLREADAGELIINMRDDSNVRTSFAYNGTVKSYIDTNGKYNGNASTATKLETARNIALGEDFTGSANFDGSGNISISGTFYRCSVSSNNTANYPWHRIAYKTGVTGAYNDTDAVFMIRATYNGGPFGIIKVSLRTNASGINCQVGARWLVRQGIAENDVYIAQWGTSGQSVYADIFLKGTTYNRTYVYQIAGSRFWTLVSSNEAADTTTSDKKTSTEVYASIATAATEIHNQAYTQTVAAWDSGHVMSATHAYLLNYQHTNEINFSGGKQVTCYFNYRDADTDAEDTGSTPVSINYKFCNYRNSTANSTITAAEFAGNATSATTASKLGTANKGSATKGIYLNAGAPAEMTYSLESSVHAGTANQLAYYSGANAISATHDGTNTNDSLYFKTGTNAKSARQIILGVYGHTYGNDASTLISGTAGVFSYGDGGPQIDFNTSSSGSQAGALIFTDHDTAAPGASWHFVSNQGDWNVTSKRFHARTSISIGTNTPNTSYNLYVNGTANITGAVTFDGSVTASTFTGNLTGNATTSTSSTASYVVARNTTAGLTTTGIQYAVGQLTIGSADGNAKEGSNASYKLWSYPAGATAVTSTLANIQNLRLYWSSIYYRDIFISPNNYDIYHRAVANNSAQAWRKILDSGNYNEYTVKKDGTGASGTWGISITGSSASCTGNAATATKATQDGNGNNIASSYIPIKTGGGIAECNGNGEYLYYTIATITISGAYVNHPILFEISGCGHHFTRLEVEFASSSSTDPGLDTNGFVADGYHGFWIKKTATSTWVVYGKYSESWGHAVLHRITGCGTSVVTVTVNMTNYGNSLPDGCTQVTYGWMALLADRATRADKASKLSTSSAIGSDTQPVYFDSNGYPATCYPMSRTSTIYDNSSGTSTIISDLTIPADTKYFKIFIFDFDTAGSHYVTNVIDIGVEDGYYGGVISGSSQSQSFPCVITVVQLIVATTSNNKKQISIGRSNSWTIGTSPSSSTHTLYIRKIIACT